jgi:hypothetical protein
MKFLSGLVTGVTLLALLLLAPVLWYYLPSGKKIYISGEDVKRMDTKIVDGKVQGHDVRFIFAKDFKTGEPVVFRNEDTAWGFPFYFKFDSADLAAKAADLAKSPQVVVLAKYYGMRSQMLELYPNVTSLEVVTAGYEYVPVASMIVVSLVIALWLYVFFKYRKFKRWLQSKLDERAGRLARKAQQA